MKWGLLNKGKGREACRMFGCPVQIAEQPQQYRRIAYIPQSCFVRSIYHASPSVEDLVWPHYRAALQALLLAQAHSVPCAAAALSASHQPARRQTSCRGISQMITSTEIFELSTGSSDGYAPDKTKASPLRPA